MTSVTLAIVSDLHVGAAACSPALRPGGLPEDGDVNFLEKLASLLKHGKRSADYLLCPGDLSDAAKPEEFSLAAEAIHKLALALKVPDKRIIAVPGNHDVNWDLIQSAGKHASAELQGKLRFMTMLADRQLGQQLGRRTKQLYEEPFVALQKFPQLLVLSFTTSAHDKRDELLHYGRVTKQAIEAAQSLLKKTSDDRERLRIILLHHHPSAWDTPGLEAPDPSQLVGAEALFKLASEWSCDFIIHGHKHHPRFRVESHDGLHPIAVLSAGSLSRKIDSCAVGTSANQFHLLTVEAREHHTNIAYGTLLSWAWVPGLNKWMPSDELTQGIAHVELFGDYTLPANLEVELEPYIRDMFTRQSHVFWKDLYAYNNRLRYCRPRLIRQVLERLALRIGFRLHGRDLDDLILVKD